MLLPCLNAFQLLPVKLRCCAKSQAPLTSTALTLYIMDTWILVRCSSLIKLVREEMAAYPLFTIIPRLLALIDELTNWYIRFNRKGLKGEGGEGDTIVALDVEHPVRSSVHVMSNHGTSRQVAVLMHTLNFSVLVVIIYTILDREHLPVAASLYSNRTPRSCLLLPASSPLGFWTFSPAICCLCSCVSIR